MFTPTDIDAERLSQIERINVIGTSGSGKSTFGRRLADSLGLPFVEMDAVYWRPNWGQPTDDEFIPQIAQIAARPRWVLDGNYSRTTPAKWERAQLVVWLDMSLTRTIYRVTSRCIKRSFSGEEVWPGTGNRETLRKSFLSRKSVILWALTNFHRNRRRYAEWFAANEYPHLAFVRLRSPGEVERFLEVASNASGLAEK